MNDMCGRFAFQGDQWPELTADIEQPVIEPNYNICPKDNSPVIHYDSDNLAITSMQWGLRPSWSKESTMEPINARVETIDSKPMFREAIVNADALFLPMDGTNGRQHREEKFRSITQVRIRMSCSWPEFTNIGEKENNR